MSGRIPPVSERRKPRAPSKTGMRAISPHSTTSGRWEKKKRKKVPRLLSAHLPGKEVRYLFHLDFNYGGKKRNDIALVNRGLKPPVAIITRRPEGANLKFYFTRKKKGKSHAAHTEGKKKKGKKRTCRACTSHHVMIHHNLGRDKKERDFPTARRKAPGYWPAHRQPGERKKGGRSARRHRAYEAQFRQPQKKKKKRKKKNVVSSIQRYPGRRKTPLGIK